MVRWVPRPGEWVLLAHPPAAQAPAWPDVMTWLERMAQSDATVADTARETDADGPGNLVTFRPVRGMEPRLGAAVLRCRDGRSVVYCREEELAAPAAAALSVLAAPSAARLLAAVASGRCGPPRARFVALAHESIPRTLHPAIAVHRLHEITVYVCAGQLSTRLAGTFSALATEQLRCLRDFAPPRPGLLRLAT